MNIDIRVAVFSRINVSQSFSDRLYAKKQEKSWQFSDRPNPGDTPQDSNEIIKYYISSLLLYPNQVYLALSSLLLHKTFEQLIG